MCVAILDHAVENPKISEGTAPIFVTLWWHSWLGGSAQHPEELDSFGGSLSASQSSLNRPAKEGAASVEGRKKRRPDFPQMRSVEKGGICNVGQPELKRQALDDLMNDMYAATSRAPRDALLRTWYKFHNVWFGDSEPVLPVTEDKILKVSSLFKKGGYKSVKNYFSRIKDHHVTSGFCWDDRLELMAKKCTRSVLRGLGGAQRSEAFDYETVVEHIKDEINSLDPEGPINPVAVVVVATLFMLREVEASAIERSDVSFGQSSVCLKLPVSKVDWQAKGCSRTWNCLCEKGLPCPVRILKEHMGLIEGLFPGMDVPLFPTQEGGPCAKQGVVNTIRCAIDAAGGCGQDNNGHWRFSGHTFRITGARLLCRLGLDPITIQLGRWGSSAVLSYLSEAPLDCFHHRISGPEPEAQLIGNRVAGVNLNVNQLHAETFHKKLKEQEEATKAYEDQVRKIKDLQGQVDGRQTNDTNASSHDNHRDEIWEVKNIFSEVRHRSLVNLQEPPAHWKTLCGWHFSGKPHAHTSRTLDSNSLGGRPCPKCYPDSKADSSSSSSSADCED